MEAKDTVMKLLDNKALEGKLRELLAQPHDCILCKDDYQRLGSMSIMSWISQIINNVIKPELEAQAEISFKAGYEEGMKSQRTPRTDLECELADEEFRREFHIARKETNMELCQAGIRKVMEFTTREFGIDWSSEKEQLKEWGLT